MQKIVITLVISLLTIFTGLAQEKHKITVNLSGMQTDKGNVYVGLYNKKENFLKEMYKGIIVAVKDKKAVAIFNDIPEGVYAISVYHDENDNKKLDTKIFGIPKEPVGCSNGAVGRFGPPKFDDAKFTLDKDTTVKVIVE